MLRRHELGDVPIRRTNTRAKWLWSANPHKSAISLIGLLLPLIRRCAVAMRRPSARSRRLRWPRPGRCLQRGERGIKAGLKERPSWVAGRLHRSFGPATIAWVRYQLRVGGV